MHGLENGDNVTPTSYTKKDEDGKKVLPTPAPRSTVPRTNDKNEISHSTSPFDGESDDKETANLNMEGSVGDGSEEPIYATIDPDTKSSKKSLDSGIDGQNSILSRSPSQETVFDNSENLDLDKTLTRLSGELSNKLSNTSSTTLPSYMSAGDSKKSLLTNSESDINDDAILKNKKTNRFLPRAKYAMQQKGFIIFTATAIILSTSAALLYLQDKAKFIAFFTNSPKYITIPVIALAAVLAISPILFAIKQFRNTAEHKTQGKDADEILDNVLGCQPENKAIKSVRLEYSNNTHSNFVFNALESENDFMNIDKKVISKTSKIESVINNRPLFTALLTGVVAANIALPLLLYAEGGVNNVQKFYQNPLTNNIGLSLLIGSGVFALLIICSGVHYYRKTNCTNLIYSQEKIDPESVNKKFIEEIKQERTEVLGENHSKDAKRSSLTLEQVVVQSHNCKDVVYSVG